MASPTLRSLARSLGLSHATVSAAISQSGRVKPATARRILKAAEAVGYRTNPLASAVMSQVRRSRNSTFRGILAAVDLAEADRPSHSVRYHADVVRGASDRARTLGFKVESFVIGRDGLPVQRLDSILHARGIRGVILLPAWNQPDVSHLDWSRYAGVYTDYAIERPALHSVYPDHYRAMMMVLKHLRGLGYRRPGMFVGAHQDERIEHRWEAAYLAFLSNAADFDPAIPVLKSPCLDGAEFSRWFCQYRPDVVLGHRTDAIAWMEALGEEVPATHGFVCLNSLMRDVPCACIDLQPHLVGSLALDQLVAQLHRNEFGIPPVASATTVPPRWMDGPTVRQPQARTSESEMRAALAVAVVFPAAAAEQLPRTG